MVFNTILGFTPNWYYKPTNAIHAHLPGVYNSDRILNSSTIDKIHLKCDVINGSLVNDIKQPKLFSFLLNRPTGYKVLCQFKTVHYMKINKPTLNTMTCYLEEDSNEEVNFNGETLTFLLQLF